MYCPAYALREGITIACSLKQARSEVYAIPVYLKAGASKVINITSCFYFYSVKRDDMCSG